MSDEYQIKEGKLMEEHAILHGTPLQETGEYTILADLLVKTAESNPHKGIGYIEGNGKETFISYSELLETAREKLYDLIEKNVQSGDVCLLLIDDPKVFHET